MNINNTHRRLALTLVSAATIIGVSACGTTGTESSPSVAAASSIASSAAPLEPSMSATPTGPATGSPETPAELTIRIESFAYAGPDSVPAGATVTVMNMDTVTANDGSFDAVVKPGASVTFTAPTKPGTYTYYCTYHSSMNGTLIVK